MRLPRRLPWANIAELDQVCSWIYTDEHGLDASTLAINRLSAWKAITPLPHALESTLSLLVVIQQDRRATDFSNNYLSLRHSYAAAIIRLVNGLVDPLQLGVYARSISSIAAQLGLPVWLVELRHAATHEDLPSLEVLREAARQSMSWLLHRYFLPTINPSSAPKHEMPPLRPLEPMLKQYKTILKTIARDASLRSRYKKEVNIIMRNIERWISEAKVAANMIVGVGWDAAGDMAGGQQESHRDDPTDSKEKWALDRFCDALLEKGGLVPLSRKKRVFSESKFWPPHLSVSVWTPLLNYIQLLHIEFAYTLCTRILSLLLPGDGSMSTTAPMQSNTSPTESKNDHSYYICLARWVMWSIDNWSNPNQDGMDGKLKKDVVSSLMQSLGRTIGDPRFKDNKVAKTLLQAICSQNLEYAIAAEFLSKASSEFTAAEWTVENMTTMTNRLDQFVSNATKQENRILPSAVISTSTTTPGIRSDTIEIEGNHYLPPGWQRVDPSNWKPCPIGVFRKLNQ